MTTHVCPECQQSKPRRAFYRASAAQPATVCIACMRRGRDVGDAPTFDPVTGRYVPHVCRCAVYVGNRRLRVFDNIQDACDMAREIPRAEVQGINADGTLTLLREATPDGEREFRERLGAHVHRYREAS